jgi:hypothetical protein
VSTRASEALEPIHTWFSLSYANYLVVPRAVLQSMPDEWQQRFVGCLEEMNDTFPDLPWPKGGYNVQALARGPELINEPCGECDGVGSVVGEDEEERDCEACGGSGETDDRRYETAEEVGVTRDRIPHYNRGRTRIEPPGERSIGGRL